jgi:hypothetical protein
MKKKDPWNTESERRCNNCMLIKSLSDFYPKKETSPKNTNTHQHRCKECMKETVRISRMEKIQKRWDEMLKNDLVMS